MPGFVQRRHHTCAKDRTKGDTEEGDKSARQSQNGLWEHPVRWGGMLSHPAAQSNHFLLPGPNDLLPPPTATTRNVRLCNTTKSA
jgi:hypothetical protein